MTRLMPPLLLAALIAVSISVLSFAAPLSEAPRSDLVPTSALFQR